MARRCGSLLVLLIALLASATPALADGSVAVSKTQYGKAWPFTVPSGTLRCVRGGIMFTAHGVNYPMNAAAMSVRPTASIQKVWRTDPGLGRKVDLRPMEKRATKLCRKS
jgi:hypothetical protein